MKKLIIILLTLLIASTAWAGFEIESPGNNNPTFTGNTTISADLTSIHTFTSANWNEDGATWTMAASGPLVHVTGNTTAVTATLTEAVVAGTTYKVTITGTGGGGTATYTFGGVTGTTIAASGAIAITDYITASTTGVMIITPASACTVSITSITVEKLTDATGDLTVDGNLTVRSPATFRSHIIGGIRAINGTVTFPGISFNEAPNSGLYYSGSRLYIAANGASPLSFYSSSHVILDPTAGLWWGSDLVLIRAAANHLALRNSTAAQTFSLYETYTDGSNYEMYSLDAGVTTNDTLTIAGVSAGGGAANLNIALVPKGTGAVKLGKTVLNLSAVTCAANACTDVPASPSLDITTDATVGADVLTIADGIAGEIRIINLKTDGTTDLAITPTNFANGTIITLDTAGESAMIRFDGTKWHVLSTYGGEIS